MCCHTHTHTSRTKDVWRPWWESNSGGSQTSWWKSNFKVNEDEVCIKVTTGQHLSRYYNISGYRETHRTWWTATWQHLLSTQSPLLVTEVIDSHNNQNQKYFIKKVHYVKVHCSYNNITTRCYYPAHIQCSDLLNVQQRCTTCNMEWCQSSVWACLCFEYYLIWQG